MTKKVFLCLMLIFFSFGQAFKANAQGLYADAYDIIKDEVVDRINKANSAYSLSASLQSFYANGEWIVRRIRGETMARIQKESLPDYVNWVFKEYREKLAKTDERLAKGKKIFKDDALEAALLYSLGYEPICSLDYQKAKVYYQCVPQTEDVKMAIIGCDYKLNKDIKAAEEAISSVSPSLTAENMANRFGLQKFYQARCNKLSAEFMPQIKRAIRAKDYEALKAYIPYKIQEVDSMLAWQNGLYKSRDYRAYNPNTESISGIIDLAESTSDQKLLQTSLQSVFSDKKNVIKELSPNGLATLAHLVKMDGDAALLYASVFIHPVLNHGNQSTGKRRKRLSKKL